MTAVHISPYSGSWYPAAASELEHLLDGLFEQSRRRNPFLFPDGLGYVVPHAGPAYSGTVAAAVYRAIQQQKPERVVLLAFPHQGGLRGVAAPDARAIATPLGEVEIDPAFGGFPAVAEERVCDHSFEIQLPFLQRAAPGARVTPLYVGRIRDAERDAAAEALAAAWRPGVVFLASSDFTHYGRNFGFMPFPADHAVAGRLRDLDYECIEAAATLDPAPFLETLEQTGATVCGSGPISLLLGVMRRLDGALYQAVLDYQTSGEITGDFHTSVSYAALGYFPRKAFDLGAGDREALLDSVAETIGRLRETGERRAFPARCGSSALAARRGLFVSLHQGEELLGCLGNCAGQATLAEDAADLALSAALEDPRFRPAASVQGPIDIEISVLTPFRRISGAEECIVGKHGLFLKLAGQAGLLLPQVATERGWTAEEFLRAVARKSGLGPRAWHDPKARLYVFEAQVFSRSRAVA
ncbi:MAG: AmmeMemoRadiSam system protein B [Bryobacteraceae bacterium]|jgi:AmmeMemoRadiSam system protein B/AmmeMemoRadiSam system protein A